MQSITISYQCVRTRMNVYCTIYVNVYSDMFQRQAQHKLKQLTFTAQTYNQGKKYLVKLAIFPALTPQIIIKIILHTRVCGF
jgi:hypothetical protein